MAQEDKVEQPIVIKKIVKAAGHHGGAWKVAYADFVTAMMAFFLLLWLLNVSTDEELNAISSYFDPSHPSVSDRVSGAGGVMGGLTMAPEGAMASNVQPITSPDPSGSAVNNKSAHKSTRTDGLENAKNAMRKKENDRMKEAEAALKKAMEENPELREMKDNLMIDMTSEGLRIQVIDQEGKPMFASGSAQMFEKTQTLLRKVAEIINDQPNQISIRGHTDSVAYAEGATYTNWELSADRANSSRRVLLDANFPANRLNDVVGKSDTEHLVPEDPTSAKNRRISIVLLKEEFTDPNYEQKARKMAGIPEETSEEGTYEEQEEAPYDDGRSTAPPAPKIGTFKRTPGAVEFP